MLSTQGFLSIFGFDGDALSRSIILSSSIERVCINQLTEYKITLVLSLWMDSISDLISSINRMGVQRDVLLGRDKCKIGLYYVSRDNLSINDKDHIVFNILGYLK